MPLEDAPRRGPTDDQALLLRQPRPMLVEGRIRAIRHLGHEQGLLLGREAPGGAGAAFRAEGPVRGLQGTPAGEGPDTDASGAGDLGVAQAGVMGLEQPFTEIAGVGGGHTTSLCYPVNPRENRSNRTF